MIVFNDYSVLPTTRTTIPLHCSTMNLTILYAISQPIMIIPYLVYTVCNN